MSPTPSNLALVRPNITDVSWWDMAKEQASMLVKTGFLPQAVNTPEKAIAIMLKGKELGIPTMYALSNIVVIQGKPTCSAELMLALVRRDYGPNAIRVKATSAAACTVQWKEWGGENEYTFTIEDARAAELLGNPTWKKFPAAMLRARCISAVCRMAFPDCIGGMYTPEELGAELSDDDMPTSYAGMSATEVPSPAVQRDAFIKAIEEVTARNGSPADWKALVRYAEEIEDGYELLIAAAPSKAYALRLVQMASEKGIPDDRTSAALIAFHDANTPPTEPEIIEVEIPEPVEEDF